MTIQNAKQSKPHHPRTATQVPQAYPSSNAKAANIYELSTGSTGGWSLGNTSGYTTFFVRPSLSG
ncbi:hypothetical protein E4U38_007767, partial [Claviceps purpurea]